MRRFVSIATGLLAFGAIPALAQSLGIEPQRSQFAGTKSEINYGRFVALGGLYGEVRLSCVPCHGLEGAANSSGAFPRLDGQVSWYLYKSLVDYASGARWNDVMSPIARTLSEREMRDVAVYYSSVQGSALPRATSAPDISVRQKGGAIAAVGLPRQGVAACASCHGADGLGNGPLYPALAGQYAAYLRYQLLEWKHGRRGGDPLDVMERIAKSMNEEQIGAVALYYAALSPPQRGRPVEALQRAQPGADPSAGSPSGGGAPSDVRGSDGTVGQSAPAAQSQPRPGAAGASPPYLRPPEQGR